MIIITEYCERGDLGALIKETKAKNQELSEEFILSVMAQMLLGLNFLHKNRIMHRDIKPGNIFIASNGEIKLGDLGSTKEFRRDFQHYTHPLGTKGYYAPEMIEYKPYTLKTDVWGCGLVLHEMCC